MAGSVAGRCHAVAVNGTFFQNKAVRESGIKLRPAAVVILTLYGDGRLHRITGTGFVGVNLYGNGRRTLVFRNFTVHSQNGIAAVSRGKVCHQLPAVAVVDGKGRRFGQFRNTAVCDALEGERHISCRAEIVRTHCRRGAVSGLHTLRQRNLHRRTGIPGSLFQCADGESVAESFARIHRSDGFAAIRPFQDRHVLDFEPAVRFGCMDFIRNGKCHAGRKHQGHGRGTDTRKTCQQFSLFHHNPLSSRPHTPRYCLVSHIPDGMVKNRSISPVSKKEPDRAPLTQRLVDDCSSCGKKTARRAASRYVIMISQIS